MMRSCLVSLSLALLGALGANSHPASVAAQAVDSVTLAVTLNSARTTATVTLTPSSSADGCEYTLFGAERASVLEGSFTGARELVAFPGSSGALQLAASALKSLRIGASGQRSARLLLRARLVCGETTTLSELAAVRLTRRSSGVRTARSWLDQFGRRLVAKDLSLSEAFPALSFSSPVDLQNAGDGTNRLFVVEQGGLIRVFANDPAVGSASTYLDLTSKISSGSERGVLGLAFHPRFSENGYFFVNYTKVSTGATVIARYQANPPSASTAELSTESVILEVAQPFSNHNGGGLAFGPDGYLYIGLGDGGSAGDPEGNGQDRGELLGKFLRVDVNSSSAGRNYGIPSDNPFVGNTSGFREEIWAYGLRNPWRFCFDPPTDRLWAGDVGQNAIEEIDLIEKGKNYGWNTMEGASCYEPSSGCVKKGKTLPITQYTHAVGQSVTGGCVYRGSAVPGLSGLYLFGDFVAGRLWTLRYDPGKETIVRELLDTDLNISSFGRDEAGEMYLLSYGDGKLYRLTPGE